MSVSGFSVQHDPEVQAYKKLRAIHLEGKATEKHRQKLQLRQIKQVRRAYLENSKELLAVAFLSTLSVKPAKETPRFSQALVCRGLVVHMPMADPLTPIGKRSSETASGFSCFKIFHVRSRSKPQRPRREEKGLTAEEEKVEKEKLMDFDSDGDSELSFTG